MSLRESGAVFLGIIGALCFIWALLFGLAIKLDWGKPAYIGTADPKKVRQNAWRFDLALFIAALAFLALAAGLYFKE